MLTVPATAVSSAVTANEDHHKIEVSPSSMARCRHCGHVVEKGTTRVGVLTEDGTHKFLS